MAKEKVEKVVVKSIWVTIEEIGDEKTEVMSVRGGCLVKCSAKGKAGTTLSVAFVPGAKLLDGRLA
jgi:hypothetical protein